ncbi:hypothetical protein [Gimibacter soli]|uniref:DUF4412 domain-containing protein n=1 Tax=Gimibacter soli TaxID=3024400 RepID=A0AAF0BKT6_9PROT|nr:hypothetical protein [Gimibacter soli]WCL53312.1 hypothetical protein PH603_12270 [Gimibacter soli]
MQKQTIKSGIALMLLGLGVSAAHADAVLTFETEEKAEMRISVGHGKVRIDQPETEDDDARFTIYDPAGPSYVFGFPADGMYRRMSGAMLGQMKKAQQNPMMKFAGAWTGEAGTAGGIGCRWAKLNAAGMVTIDVCLADEAAFGLTKDELAAMEAAMSFGGGAYNDMESMGLSGVPVIVRGEEGATRLKKVESASLTRDLFEVPSDMIEDSAGE